MYTKNPNMLSAKNIKIHGMSSSRWTTRDKITQYKGLIKLYMRDDVIMEADAEVTKDLQGKQLEQLHKSIEKGRKQFKTAVRGDKQKLKNTLAEHKELQLAYQDELPTEAILAIRQINFNKRKELDRLGYKIKRKSEELTQLKLELSVLQDGIKYPDRVPIEENCGMVKGKIEDTMKKQRTALEIRKTLKLILDIMKKDSLYFDGILNTLRADAEAQGACMLTATKLGQAATEYLDARRTEYSTLEATIRKDMAIRKEDIFQMKKAISENSNNVKQLVRSRRKDFNRGIITIEKSPSELELRENYAQIEGVLNILKSGFRVSNYDMIFPYLQSQVSHFERLTEHSKMLEEKRTTLSKKAEHAAMIRDMLVNSMAENTLQYMSEKKLLLAQQVEETEKLKYAQDELRTTTALLATIRISLNHFQQMIKIIRMEGLPVETVPQPGDEETIVRPEVDEIHGVKISRMLRRCFRKLMRRAAHKEPVSYEEKFTKYEEMILGRSRIVHLEKKISEESLLEGMDLDYRDVPNRNDIKNLSDRIVEMFTQSEEYKAAHGKI